MANQLQKLHDFFVNIKKTYLILVLLLSLLSSAIYVLLKNHEGSLVSSGNPKHFIADIIGPLPAELNSEKVDSSTDYLILAHLVRPLVRLNKNAQLEGDLATSWLIEDNYTKFEFVLSKDAKWSNGISITAADFEKCFNLLREAGPTVHFDFTTIRSVDSIGSKISIRLYSPNPNFLVQLTHPESSLVYWKTHGRKQVQDFSITAGPYFLSSQDPNKIGLTKNKYYPWSSNSSPEFVTIVANATIEDQIKDLLSKKTEFLNPRSGMTLSQFTPLNNSTEIQK